MHCNDAFEQISGLSHDELIGQPHNLIRHPDMPPEAFQVMWDTLKSGSPWMGLVKNRCKNGDHYWVNAYVTPVTDRAQRSVNVALEGHKDAEPELEKVVETEDKLNSISESVSSIANVAIQMAAAVEEQAHVSEEINRQVVNISELANNSMGKAGDSSQSILVLQEISQQLHELVVRFKK